MSTGRSLLPWLLGTAFVLAPGSANAQEHISGASGHEEHFHRNELALVLASTYEAAEGENLLTLGGEYERRLTTRRGAAFTFEHLSALDGWVLIFPVTFRVYRDLKLLAGPGLEHPSRRMDAHGDAGEAENRFLFRVGVQYGFELGERCSIVPGIELDWIDEEHEVARALVYGVSLGVAF